jgi:hypothetical protein
MYRFYSIIHPPAIPKIQKHSHTIIEFVAEKWEAIHLADVFCSGKFNYNNRQGRRKQGFGCVPLEAERRMVGTTIQSTKHHII